MLNDSRRLYENYADVLLPDWRVTDKNELCFMYSNSTDSNERDSLFTVIVVKFWYMIDIFANKCKFMPVESTYDMYLDSLRYILDKAVWKDKNSSICDDKKAPEKCLMTRMKSQRLNKIRDMSRQKDILNLLAIPIESLKSDDFDESPESMLCTDKSFEADMLMDSVKFIVIHCIQHKQYLRSLIVYILSTSPYSYDDVRGKRYVYSAIRGMNDKFCEEFSNMFDVDEDLVRSIASQYRTMTKEELRRRVNNIVIQLKNCSDVREMLNAY